MITPDENTIPYELRPYEETRATSWYNWIKTYRGCKFYVRQYNVDWSWTTPPKYIEKGMCDVQYMYGPSGESLYYSNMNVNYIEESELEYYFDSIIGNALELEKPFVEYRNKQLEIKNI